MSNEVNWQPIETAPTDGTRILLRGRNGRIADGHYGQPDGFANPKLFVWPYINATPTHWAPLALIAAAPELLAAAMNELTPPTGMTKSAAQRRIEGQLQAAIDLLKQSKTFVARDYSVRAQDLSKEITEFVGAYSRK